MKKSLVYNLYQHDKTTKADPKLFELVWKSTGDQMRIFKVLNVSKESKEWVADPANKICDAPGSWYCGGQYPPALRPLIEKRKNFAQLEDFNSAKDAKAKADAAKYQREYMERMAGGGG